MLYENLLEAIQEMEDSKREVETRIKTWAQEVMATITSRGTQGEQQLPMRARTALYRERAKAAFASGYRFSKKSQQRRTTR